MAIISNEKIKKTLEDGLIHLQTKEISLNEIVELCNLFKTFINQRLLIEMNQNKINIQIKGRYKETSIKDIILMGNEFIFKLRTFLTGEKIDYLLGGTYNDENNESQLAQKIISQEEIFKNNNLIFNFQSGIIELNSNLYNFSNQDIMNNNIGYMWMQILNLSKWKDEWVKHKDPQIVGGVKVQDFYNTKKKGLIKRYRSSRFYTKIQADEKVAVRYKGKDKHRVGGYYLKNGKRYFFNEGWLFEWFQEYLGNQYDINFLQASLNKGSIEPIIKKMNNFRSSSGGDFYNRNNVAIQAKYGNQKVIKITTILKIVDRLLINLKALQATEENYSTKVAEVLAKEFSNNENENLLKNKILESVKILLKNDNLTNRK